MDITKHIIVTQEILQLISEMDEFKGMWKVLSHLLPERRLDSFKKVATIESIGSSTRIEGVTLTDKQIEEILSGVRSHSFTSRDEQEVAGYALVCEEIYSHFGELQLTESTIKQLHNWLLSYSSKDVRHKGTYKKFPNHVEAFDPEGRSLWIVFKTGTPSETPLKMEQLLSWTHEALEQKAVHPLLVIAVFVVIFLAIHPFQDGNGRLSRLLTMLLLLQNGYSYVVYSSLESIIERNKESYYLALRRTQGSLEGQKIDFLPWTVFFLQSMQKQKNHLNQKIISQKILQSDISQKSFALLELIMQHRELSASQIEKLTSLNKHTIKKHLQVLVEQELILKRGKGRATSYIPV